MFLSSAVFFYSKSTLFEHFFQETVLVSNKFDADQARQFVGSDLTGGHICLHGL